MARASSYTHLSLDRWAQIMGLNPVHFAGAVGETVWPYGTNVCEDVWPQHPWQSYGIISREELAKHIRLAEQTIMRQLSYSVAPTWISAEEHRFPKHHDRGWQPVTDFPRSLHTRYRHVIAGGRRAVENLDTDVSVTYSDEDGDGFSETATVTISGVTVSERREIKLFFAGHGGRPEWEIRPLRESTLISGVFTATFDSWLAIDPSLWDKHPTGYEHTPIDITTTANLASTVDIYRVYNSIVSAPGTFYNSIGFYCQECSNVGCANCTQDGCILVENGKEGKVLTSPATWDEETEVWGTSYCNREIDARTVKLWYYAGHQSEDYMSGLSDDPLDDLLAEAVAMLATARLSKPVCSCSNVRETTDDLRKDYGFTDRNTFNLIWRNESVQNNPFGTRAGEVKAWRIVNEIIGDAVLGGVM